MTWQWTPYTIPLIAAAAIAAIAALYIWRHRHASWSGTSALLLLARVQWMMGYALELSSANLPAPPWLTGAAGS